MQCDTCDLFYDKETNKQFITIQTKNCNTFYTIIDYDAPVNDEEEQYQSYFKFVRSKKQKDEDLDFFDDEAYEEEPYINEDDESENEDEDEPEA